MNHNDKKKTPPFGMVALKNAMIQRMVQQFTTMVLGIEPTTTEWLSVASSGSGGKDPRLQERVQQLHQWLEVYNNIRLQQYYFAMII